MKTRHFRRWPNRRRDSQQTRNCPMLGTLQLASLCVVLSQLVTAQQTSSSLSVIQTPQAQLQASSSSLSVIQQLSDQQLPQLQMQLQQKSKYKTKVACEDKILAIQCEPGFAINLIRANYGRFSLMTCNEQGILDLSTDCTSAISFRVMQERCQSKSYCSVNATSATFGDKCPRTRKYLEVHYHCVEESPHALPPFGASDSYKPGFDPRGYVNVSPPPSRKNQDNPFQNEQQPHSPTIVQPPTWPNDLQPISNPYSGIHFNPSYDNSFVSPSPNIVQPQQPPVDVPSFDPDLLSNTATNSQQQQQERNSPQSLMMVGFIYFVVTMIVVLVVVLLIAVRRRSNALKNVFLSDSASHRTDDTLHNKDLLVINNQNGHQFLYTPANSTKINAHMLTGNHVTNHQTFSGPPQHLQQHHNQHPHHQSPFGQDFVLGPNSVRNALTLGNSQQHHHQHHATLHHSPFSTQNQIYSSLARGTSSQSSHSAGQSNYYCYVKI